MYDTGATMVGTTAPACRVGWWHYESSTSGYTPAATALFDAAVAWAGGTSPIIGYTRDATDRITQRTINNHVEEKYSYTATGDTSDLSLDPSGNVTEATLILPGGALYTWRSSAPVWSYPNLNGNIVATTDGSGNKVGPTQAYDPYGKTLTATTAGQLDNSTGQGDYAWEGQAQRLTENQSGTVPIVEMGARPYDPGTGRFLRVDPVEGGCSNAYVYVRDPLNRKDLDGTAECPSWVKTAARILGFGDFVRALKELARGHFKKAAQLFGASLNFITSVEADKAILGQLRELGWIGAKTGAEALGRIFFWIGVVATVIDFVCTILGLFHHEGGGQDPPNPVYQRVYNPDTGSYTYPSGGQQPWMSGPGIPGFY